jgi:hypothetical protein
MPKKIKVNIFDDMREALHDAAAYERGQAVNLRITKVPTRPKDPHKEIRPLLSSRPKRDLGNTSSTRHSM